MLLALALALSPARAADAALTFSIRALAGASARVEFAASPTLSPFVELGASAWIIPGDDPEQGGSIPLLRPHAKVGLDLGRVEGGLYWGPRAVLATNLALGATSNIEAGLLGTVGYKHVGEQGGRFQVGGGLCLHAMRTLEDPPNVALFPLPHVELRFGF